ncbi:hypothetical protein GJ689_19605 [Rhodoplanes serenus]|uniref:Uncharacterized protein n=1 Tax=Rhodoplanes serenus TaxID=200615 RepID=A0A9X5AUJ2_9BRAD|nr:hypothetical protein [Rhodoplanes serenus]MTW18410.1 hypothetical protein [Rhodoplanes serenus]
MSQLFRWRQQLCGTGPSAGFAEATILPEPRVAEDPSSVAVAPSGLIEVEFPAAPRLRVSGVVDPATLTAVIDALAKAGRR